MRHQRALGARKEVTMNIYLRLVTVAEDDGSQTQWILISWQEGADERGHRYVRLILARDKEVREDIMLDPLEFSACMHDREHWPFVKLDAFWIMPGDELPAAPAWPIMARAKEVVIVKEPDPPSCPCGKLRCKGQCMQGAPVAPKRPTTWRDAPVKQQPALAPPMRKWSPGAFAHCRNCNLVFGYHYPDGRCMTKAEQVAQGITSGR